VLGGTFGLALLFLVLRAEDTETTTELSGMAQAIGYFIAAIGPVMIGSLFDYTGNWNYPIIALIIIATAKLLVGLEAGRQGTVKRI
jgi:CP family cyanate transporter-like MFS transporter